MMNIFDPHYDAKIIELIFSEYKTIQPQTMMYVFDHQYDVETKELIFPECNMNKFIDRQMIYFLDDDYK